MVGTLLAGVVATVPIYANVRKHRQVDDARKRRTDAANNVVLGTPADANVGRSASPGLVAQMQTVATALTEVKATLRAMNATQVDTNNLLEAHIEEDRKKFATQNERLTMIERRL